MGLSFPVDPSQDAIAAQHSVSIAAISDQTAVTGTISCNSTVTGGTGPFTFAWSGEGPAGAAVAFADDTAEDTTITLSAATVPGNYAIRLIVTDTATGLTASAVAYFRVGGDVTEGIRGIEVRVVGGALVAQEVVLVGDVWVEVGSPVASTVETDGGVTYSGTTMTIPSGIAARSTGANTCTHEEYFAMTSFSAAFQAMLTNQYQCYIMATETSMETTANARWGVALTTAAGSFDAGTENIHAVLTGHNGTNWSHDTCLYNASWVERSTGASLGRRFLRGQIAHSGLIYHLFHGTTPTVDTAAGTAVSAPTRLYVIACAKTTPTAADTDVVDPIVRFVVTPIAL